MKDILPTRPANLDPLAADMLERLREAPEASHLVIGGGVALNCYITPRMTRDVDAWWSQVAAPRDREVTVLQIRTIANEVAALSNLSVAERPLSSNDVVSIELQENRRTVFSFQIAPRDVQLEPPLLEASPFAPIPLEALSDNLGAKMTALVSRGLHRDFQDVFAIVQTGVATVDELWSLYARKQPDRDLAIAKAQTAQRLAAIEQRRPLADLDPDSRGAAAELRAWVREALVGKPFELRPANLSRTPTVEREAQEQDNGHEL